MTIQTKVSKTSWKLHCENLTLTKMEKFPFSTTWLQLKQMDCFLKLSAKFFQPTLRLTVSCQHYNKNICIINTVQVSFTFKAFKAFDSSKTSLIKLSDEVKNIAVSLTLTSNTNILKVTWFQRKMFTNTATTSLHSNANMCFVVRNKKRKKKLWWV